MSDSRYRAIKAYKNQGFLNSPEARGLRILSEYVEPNSRFRELQVRDTIVVFGSARIQPRDKALALVEEAKQGKGDLQAAERKLKMSRYYEETRELSAKLTTWSKGLEGTERRFVICSGGGPGIMEAANRGASEARGENIGLNISLPFEQNDNPYITHRLSFEFHYFFMRKFWFSYLAKAFIIFPGGFGTMDELFEVLTLIQTDKIRKKVAIVLYGKEYWEQIINLGPMVEFGTISAEDLDLFHISDDVEDAFQYVSGYLQEHILDRERKEEQEPTSEQVGSL